jgi:hypothetical protein
VGLAAKLAIPYFNDYSWRTIGEYATFKLEAEMAQLIARIELRGNPSAEVYEKLHLLMKTRGWNQQISSTQGEISLPHAMYQVESDKNPVDLSISIHKQVKDEVWTKPVVLVMAVANWGMEGH